MQNKFVDKLLKQLNKGETFQFTPVKLGTPGRGLSLDMITAITLMVNLGKPVDMPVNDRSPLCTVYDEDPTLPVLGVFFRQRENDPDAEEDNEEQKKRRGEVLVLLATKAGLETAAKYSKTHGDGDPGDSFGEWAQAMGFPFDLWSEISTMFGLAFREVEFNINNVKKPENKILAKFNVSDFRLSCPNPEDDMYDIEEVKKLGDGHLNAIFFYKGEEV